MQAVLGLQSVPAQTSFHSSLRRSPALERLDVESYS